MADKKQGTSISSSAIKRFGTFFTEGKDAKADPLAVLEAVILVASMAAFLFIDPFHLNNRIAEFLRLKYSIFVEEPKLLFYIYANIGGAIAKIAVLLLIILFVLTRREKLAQRLGVEAPDNNNWVRYIAPFALFPVVVRIFSSGDPLLPGLPIRFIFPEAMIIGNVVIFFFAILVAPVAEEMIFRGYLFDTFKRNFGINSSIILTAALFALAHMPQSGFEIAHMTLILIFGIILGLLRQRSGSILPTTALHCVYNLIYALAGTLTYYFTGL